MLSLLVISCISIYMKLRKGIVGWYLPIEQRNELLKVFPPKYEHVVAHHITDQFGVYEDAILPTETKMRIIGIIDDGEGIEALIVSIQHDNDLYAGRVKSETSWYHITWSHAEGRKPVESNNFCKEEYFERFTGNLINVEPKFFPFGGK